MSWNLIDSLKLFIPSHSGSGKPYKKRGRKILKLLKDPEYRRMFLKARDQKANIGRRPRIGPYNPSRRAWFRAIIRGKTVYWSRAPNLRLVGISWPLKQNYRLLLFYIFVGILVAIYTELARTRDDDEEIEDDREPKYFPDSEGIGDFEKELSYIYVDSKTWYDAPGGINTDEEVDTWEDLPLTISEGTYEDNWAVDSTLQDLYCFHFNPVLKKFHYSILSKPFYNLFFEFQRFVKYNVIDSQFNFDPLLFNLFSLFCKNELIFRQPEKVSALERGEITLPEAYFSNADLRFFRFDEELEFLDIELAEEDDEDLFVDALSIQKQPVFIDNRNLAGIVRVDFFKCILILQFLLLFKTLQYLIYQDKVVSLNYLVVEESIFSVDSFFRLV